MKILHLNTQDQVGGAAKAVHRLHHALQTAGHASRLVVGWQTGTAADVDHLVPDRSWWDRVVQRTSARLDYWLGLQYVFVPWSERLLRLPAIQSADLIHLHNLHGGHLSTTMLPRLTKMAPVVWTLHDMWALTGHCAFAFDCERWKAGCGRCPQLSDYPALAIDTTAFLWRLKQRVYARSALTIVTPSEWLAQRVRQSPLLGRFPLRCIPHGIDTELFRPSSQPAARAALNLPVDAHVVFFAATPMTEPRKGGAYLLEALARLTPKAQERLWLVTAGSGAALTNGAALPYRVRHLGLISDDAALATAYAAADVFAAPSLAESFGLVLVEAMACGTPVLAFHTTAVPEVVRHLETGYLAAAGSAEDLAYGLQRLLDDEPLRRRLAEQSRQRAETEYRLELHVARYLQLYRELLAERA